MSYPQYPRRVSFADVQPYDPDWTATTTTKTEESMPNPSSALIVHVDENGVASSKTPELAQFLELQKESMKKHLELYKLISSRSIIVHQTITDINGDKRVVKYEI